ncbi:hypothetical protein RhiirC2_798658 [Rhizophagus irregularis]|uniref:Uncharacterized protein n=1 Tax=Rhizophagus irregularis TaxID=588596 RepID=A0A2N1M679_9GLOM|nr:hypothetical protein RhiirC2_798658 [Rhizophagus irregularis]
MPPDAPRDLTSLDNYINGELIKRLGVANANYAKLSKQINATNNQIQILLIDNDTSSSESEDSSSSSESSSSNAEINVNISQKKKSKTCKSHKVKDIETPPLALIPIYKKKKQSSKSPSQDDQSHLEKIIEKILEKMLNKKFGTITTLLHPQNDDSKIPADSENNEFMREFKWCQYFIPVLKKQYKPKAKNTPNKKSDDTGQSSDSNKPKKKDKKFLTKAAKDDNQLKNLNSQKKAKKSSKSKGVIINNEVSAEILTLLCNLI